MIILVFLPPPDIKAYLWKEIDKCSRGNNAVLGLELDLTLRGIGGEFKGWTHLDKPYVAKKQILHAVRRQNEVILALQAKILDMAKIDAGLQITMNALQK